jgi:hypothetical protein
MSNEGPNDFHRRLQVHERRLRKVAGKFSSLSSAFSTQDAQVRRVEAIATMIHDNIKELHTLIKGNGQQPGLELKFALLEARFENLQSAVNSSGQGTKAWVHLITGALISGTVTVITMLLMRGIK